MGTTQLSLEQKTPQNKKKKKNANLIEKLEFCNDDFSLIVHDSDKLHGTFSLIYFFNSEIVASKLLVLSPFLLSFSFSIFHLLPSSSISVY